MIIITKEINAYDQDGEYFEVAFDKASTLNDLSQYFYKKNIDNINDDQIMFLTHLKRGGGRINTESVWFNYHSIKSGESIN